VPRGRWVAACRSFFQGARCRRTGRDGRAVGPAPEKKRKTRRAIASRSRRLMVCFSCVHQRPPMWPALSNGPGIQQKKGASKGRGEARRLLGKVQPPRALVAVCSSQKVQRMFRVRPTCRGPHAPCGGARRWGGPGGRLGGTLGHAAPRPGQQQGRGNRCSQRRRRHNSRPARP